MKRDLLSLWDLSPDEIHQLISRACEMKEQWSQGRFLPRAQGKTLGLLFVKPSTRTRISFETAMHQLGGQSIFVSSQDTQLSRGETVADMARVISRYLSGLVIRTYEQEEIEEFAANASIPIINGLTDLYHPCQVLGDLMTIREKRGSLKDLRVAWIGDGNNMAHSWINAAALLGFTLFVSCPSGYEPNAAILDRARNEGAGVISLVRDPLEAVSSADVINTDVWASMGDAETEKRKQAFQAYQVGKELLDAAPSHAVVLHCLPAHRGDEITSEVMDGPQSVVFDQAENRLHLQKALLDWLLN
jgi:ornithine carbamoyltransferase